MAGCWWGSYRARQPEIHAAQDGENTTTIMQEIWCRERNVETSIYILCECLALERVRRKTLGRTRMEMDQIKKVRLGGIVALDKGPRMLYGPLK